MESLKDKNQSHLSSISLTKGLMANYSQIEKSSSNVRDGKTNNKNRQDKSQSSKQRNQSCSPNLKTNFDQQIDAKKYHSNNPNSKPLQNSNIFASYNVDLQPIYEKKTKQMLQTPKRDTNTNTAQKKGVKTTNNKQKNQKLKLTQLKDLKPINLEQEKSLFFQKMYIYNPSFLYTSTNVQFSIEKPHIKYLDLSIRILDAVNQLYGSFEEYFEQDGGQIITQEETTSQFCKYINDLEIAELITFEFSENTISPTTCVHSNSEGTSKIVIGLPITYRKDNIIGILNHEIGTHFLRKFNDKVQKWYKQRKKLDLQNYSKIEEGLATINQYFEKALDQSKRPFLYKAALHYYASVLSSQLSFQHMFKVLERYIKTPEERWKTCVRVKRGITNTSTEQGQYKDQIYLRGAIKVLRYRKQLNFLNLHSGKITVKDCLRLTEKGQINSKDGIKMPYFLKDIDLYQQALEKIAKTNFIE